MKKNIKTFLLLSICILYIFSVDLKKRHHEKVYNEKFNKPGHHIKHKNVYIYNRHYHINQPSSVITPQPSINSIQTTHDLIHHDLHSIPKTTYIPKVHWVDD